MMNPGPKSKERLFAVIAKVAFVLWVILITLGSQILISYTNTRGRRPENDRVDLASLTNYVGQSEYSLILFLHPKCSCSRATLRELKVILNRAPASWHLTVVMYCPQGATPSWVRGTNERLAKDLGPQEFVLDQGELFQRNQILDSGHILCFDRNQELKFSGGVTVSRSHEGPNQAHAALANILNGGNEPMIRFPVFGCAVQQLSLSKESSL